MEAGWKLTMSLKFCIVILIFNTKTYNILGFLNEVLGRRLVTNEASVCRYLCLLSYRIFELAVRVM